MISALILFAVGYGAALAGLYVFQRRLMYFPSAVAVPPAAVGLPEAERIRLETADGEILLGWLIPPAPGRAVILYFHGNGGGLDLRAERFGILTRSGYGLLGIEYRGYAGSTGAPSEAGLIADGEAAWKEAIRRGFPPQRLALMGESLGSGVAVALASRHRPGALVLDSPYSSIADVAAWRFPIFPVRRLIKDSFRSDLRIADVHAPLFVAHGTNDWVVPIRFGRALFAAANEPKLFETIPGAGHLALGLVLPDVIAWLDRTIAPEGKSGPEAR